MTERTAVAATKSQPTAGGLNAGQFFALSPEAQEDYLSGRVGGTSGDLLRQLAVHQLSSANQQKENDAKQKAYSRVGQYREISRGEAAGAVAELSRLTRYRNALAEAGFLFPNTGELSAIPPMNLRREIVVELNSEVKNQVGCNALSIGRAMSKKQFLVRCRHVLQ